MGSLRGLLLVSDYYRSSVYCLLMHLDGGVQVELQEPFLTTSAIEALELPTSAANSAFTAGCWMALYYPNLRTFITNNSEATDDMLVSRFWARHGGLERVELSDSFRNIREWFPQISHGCFPKLRALKV